MGLRRLDVHMTADAIVYDRVPYKPCTLYPSGRLLPAAIAEVDPDGFPPTIWTRAGEILPVPRAQADSLKAFAQHHGLPIIRREDIWSALLDPFLDTEHSPECEQRDLDILARVGLDVAAVAVIRKRVEPRMMALTFVTWEWQYYGLFDVLDAFEPWLFPDLGRGIFRPVPFPEFYREAMAIARRGRALPLIAPIK